MYEGGVTVPTDPLQASGLSFLPAGLLPRYRLHLSEDPGGRWWVGAERPLPDAPGYPEGRELLVRGPYPDAGAAALGGADLAREGGWCR